VLYPDKEKVHKAFLRWYSGEEGSDENAASDLLYLYEIRNVTHPAAVQSAKEIGASWLQRAISAAQDDPDFFRRIAGILEFRKRHPKNRGALLFVFSAYWHLTRDPHHNLADVTKKKVRELALQRWAFSRLVDRKKLSGEYTDEFTPGQKAVIQQEIDRLPKQRWQDIWRRAALEDLPGSKRGPNSIQ
jgi:hypothetical protein